MHRLSKASDSGSGSTSVTLRDVAKDTGFHVTTISKALRSHPSIPEATRKVIQGAAQRLGYSPNPVMSALTRFRSAPPSDSHRRCFAFITSSHAFSCEDLRCSPIDMYAGASGEARRLGFELLTIVAGEGEDLRWISSFFNQVQVCGYIVAGDVPGMSSLDLTRLPVCTAGICTTGGVPCRVEIGINHQADVLLLIRRLASLGYRRAGLVLGSRLSNDDARYAAAFLDASVTQSAELIVPILSLSQTDTRSSSGMVLELDAWIRANDVDVVVSPDVGACNLVKRLAALETKPFFAGLSLPRDFGPTIAGVRADFAGMGAQAVAALAGILNTGGRKDAFSCERILLGGYWTDGANARSSLPQTNVV